MNRVWVNPFVGAGGQSVRGHWRMIGGGRTRHPKGSRPVSPRPGVHAPFGMGRPRSGFTATQKSRAAQGKRTTMRTK